MRSISVERFVFECNPLGFYAIRLGNYQPMKRCRKNHFALAKVANKRFNCFFSIAMNGAGENAAFFDSFQVFQIFLGVMKNHSN